MAESRSPTSTRVGGTAPSPGSSCCLLGRSWPSWHHHDLDSAVALAGLIGAATTLAASWLRRNVVEKDASGDDIAKTWCFRIRMNLGGTVKFDCDEPQWIVPSDDRDLHISLCPADGSSRISDARRLALFGSGYESEVDAESEGLRWRDRLMLALASVNVGAELGARSLGGGFSSYALAQAGRMSGVPVLADAHGLMIYESTGETLFGYAVTIDAQVGKKIAPFASAISRLATLELNLPARIQLGYELYSASFSEKDPESRFLMLMMAIETLLDRESR